MLALQNLSKPNRHHFSHGDVLERTSLLTCQSTSQLTGERLEGVLSVPVLSFHKRWFGHCSCPSNPCLQCLLILIPPNNTTLNTTLIDPDPKDPSTDAPPKSWPWCPFFACRWNCLKKPPISWLWWGGVGWKPGRQSVVRPPNRWHKQSSWFTGSPKMSYAFPAIKLKELGISKCPFPNGQLKKKTHIEWYS